MTLDERAELVIAITSAIKSSAAQLTEQEQEWVRMAIQREAQSIALRRAIIEKSLSGLIWSGIVGCGYVFLDFAKNHGFK